MEGQTMKGRTEERYRKLGVAVCVCAAVLFALSLIPMLALARYDVPSADDYSFGAQTHQVWLQTGSLAAVLRMSAARIKALYLGWQGSFAAMFLMTLQPAVFGEEFYCLTPYVMLGVLIPSVLFFCWTLFRRTFGTSRGCWFLTALFWLTLTIQNAPRAVEGFYWFNGASYYMGFFSLSLVLYGLLLLYVRQETPWKRRTQLALAALLAAGIGGGNYTTALLSTLLLAGGVVLLAVTKNRRFLGLLLPLLALLATFVLSMAAPGNAVRAAECHSMAAVPAILRSLETAAVQIGRYTTVVTVLALALLSPVLWRGAKRVAFSFPCPVLVVLVSFGLYAAQLCPPLYAMSFPGPGRLQNIVYAMYVFLMVFDLFYVLGWVAHHHQGHERKPRDPWRDATGMVLLGAALVVCCFAVPRQTPFTSVSALKALCTGGPQQYYGDYQARLELLEDPQQQTVVLQPFSQRPYLLYFDDATADPTDWRNVAMANYYGKRQVTVERPGHP